MMSLGLIKLMLCSRTRTLKSHALQSRGLGRALYRLSDRNFCRPFAPSISGTLDVLQAIGLFLYNGITFAR